MGMGLECDSDFPCGDPYGDPHKNPVGMGWEWDGNGDRNSTPTATLRTAHVSQHRLPVVLPGYLQHVTLWCPVLPLMIFPKDHTPEDWELTTKLE